MRTNSNLAFELGLRLRLRLFRSERQFRCRGWIEGIAGHSLQKLRVHFVCDHHHVGKKLIEINTVGVQVQGMEDADLQAARFFDQRSRGVALLAPQTTMFRCRPGRRHLCSDRDGVPKAMDQLEKQLGQVRRTSCRIDLACG